MYWVPEWPIYKLPQGRSSILNKISYVFVRWVQKENHFQGKNHLYTYIHSTTWLCSQLQSYQDETICSTYHIIIKFSSLWPHCKMIHWIQNENIFQKGKSLRRKWTKSLRFPYWLMMSHRKDLCYPICIPQRM